MTNEQKYILKRLYENKLATNLNMIADKPTVKLIKDSIKGFCESVLAKNKTNATTLKIITTDDERDNLKDVLKLALKLDDNTIISNTMLAKAVISACKHKFVTTEKGVKVGKWSYSVSDFLKSLNASIVGKIEKSSFAD